MIKLVAIIKKVLTTVPKVVSGILGVAQAIVKFIKEVLTLAVDILYPAIPSAKFKVVVDTIRGIINVADKCLQELKVSFLKIGD